MKWVGLQNPTPQIISSNYLKELITVKTVLHYFIYHYLLEIPKG